MDNRELPGVPAWTTRPMRWAQLTLVENDPATIDVDWWLEYFRDTHAEGVCLSAGGYIAYYPTDIPLHYPSAWLKGRDIFGELVDGCRTMDMSILARSDPHAVHQDVRDVHPEWIAVGADGRFRQHWSMPGAWVTCALGEYNFTYMTDVHREMVRRYQVDGIFSNRWAGSGMCYCDSCQRNFRAYSGFDLPRDKVQTDEVWIAYKQWREQRLLELCDVWDAAIRDEKVDARYIPNSGGGALSQLDMKALSDRTPILFADKQARSGILPPWGNGKNAKEFRAVFGKKAVGGIFSVGIEEKYRWKDSVQHPEELRIWMASAIANGMRPWFTKFAATTYDKRWLEPVREMYTWHAENERYFRNTQNKARVAVVYSQQTAQVYGGEKAHALVEDPIMGAYQALIEARIPFEMVYDQCLDAASLAPFKVLVLPNIAVLSDAQCQQLRDFVNTGGSLVATFVTSLWDENGRQRDNFGLADLFGVNYGGEITGPLKNAYLNVERVAPEAELLLAGCEGMERIIHGAYRVHLTEPSREIPSPLTLVPAYPDLPMEEVYPREERTDIPGIICRKVGEGRVVYLPWDIARTFWEVLSVDHGRIFANAVRWVLDEPDLVQMDAPGMWDVTLWTQEGSLTVHLLNLTNPMAMRGSFREFVPVGPITLRVRWDMLPAIKRVHLLQGGIDLELQHDQGFGVVYIPEVADYDVVAFDF